MSYLHIFQPLAQNSDMPIIAFVIRFLEVLSIKPVDVSEVKVESRYATIYNIPVDHLVTLQFHGPNPLGKTLFLTIHETPEGYTLAALHFQPEWKLASEVQG